MTTLALAPVAYMSMFSSFRLYDDEGYFLLTLKDYMSGHPLLGPYTPLYGPFFYEVMGGLFKVLGLVPAHDNGRFITLGVWLLTSLIGGLAAFRLTRNLWLGLGAQFVTFEVLTALRNEPSNSYGLTSLLLMGLIWSAAYRTRWPRATAALIGGIVGALLMIKINVGAFAALAVGFAWACSLPHRARLFAVTLMGVLMVIAPPLLMRDFLNRDWALEFAAVAALSAAAVGLVGVMAAPLRLPPSSGRWLAGGGTTIVAISLGVALVGGTSVADVGNMFATSFRSPKVFSTPLTTGAVYNLWAAVSIVAAFVVLRRLSHDRLPAAAFALARCGAGLFTVLLLLTLPEPIIVLGVPLVWLTAIPSRRGGDDPTDAYARALLPALAVMGFLQAYPVAGSQLSLASLGLVPVGAIGLNDGLRELRGLTDSSPGRFRPVMWVAQAVLGVNVAVFLMTGILTAVQFKAETPLGLRGAESVRLPSEEVAQLRALVADVDRACSSFITFPGLDSFYLWTDQEPPTPLRYQLWWITVDTSKESSMVRELDRRPRLCVVKSQAVLDFWLEGHQLVNHPLVDFIKEDFVDRGSYGVFDLQVRS